MIDILVIIDNINKLKSENNPSKLIDYIISLEGNYFPSRIMLDKARAIQISEGNDYDLEDSKKIFEMILRIEPDYIPAYIEMGYYTDTVLDEPKAAIDIIDKGIMKAQHLLDELIIVKAQALYSMGKYKEAAGLRELLCSKDEKIIEQFDSMERDVTDTTP